MPTFRFTSFNKTLIKSLLGPHINQIQYFLSPQVLVIRQFLPAVNFTVKAGHHKSKSQDQDHNQVLSPELIHHLERTSLVDFSNDEGLRRLERAIEFANKILEVDTTGVEPMSTVLEEIKIHLREDIAVPTNREDILLNASVTEEDYFVSPPGNIPLEADTSKSYTKVKNVNQQM